MLSMRFDEEEKERVNIPLKTWVASMMEPAEIRTWKQDAGKHELLSVGKKIQMTQLCE